MSPQGNIVAELARVTVEEVYNEDYYEALAMQYPDALEDCLEEEYREAERDAACYGLEWDVMSDGYPTGRFQGGLF